MFLMVKICHRENRLVTTGMFSVKASDAAKHCAMHTTAHKQKITWIKMPGVLRMRKLCEAWDAEVEKLQLKDF